MPGITYWQKTAKAIISGLLVLLLTFTPISTSNSLAARVWKRSGSSEAKPAVKVSNKLAETPPPIAIQELRQELENYRPQVTILSPRSNEVVTDSRISVQFQVKDLPLFQEPKFGLGPHLHVLLDNRTYQAVYDASKPLVFEKLEPGTHTIRAFASRPWHESFKNEGAYAQTTFHVFTKTQENRPDPNLPLLTYSRPQGTYGAEPIMLDFYLTNAPLHVVAREDRKDDIADWRIRCTVNGNSFLLDQWQPVYLKGFKPGKNWIQLEFLDENGDPVPNVFNNTARLITYEPGGQDALSKLIRGDLVASETRGIVDPNYKPPVPVPTPIPTPTVSPSPQPTATPELTVTPKSTVTPQSSPTPKPTVTPKSTVTPQSSPTPKPTVTPKSTVTPQSNPTPKPTVTPEPATPQSNATPKPTVTPEPTAPDKPSAMPQPGVIPTSITPIAPSSDKIAPTPSPRANPVPVSQPASEPQTGTKNIIVPKQDVPKPGDVQAVPTFPKSVKSPKSTELSPSDTPVKSGKTLKPLGSVQPTLSPEPKPLETPKPKLPVQSEPAAGVPATPMTPLPIASPQVIKPLPRESEAATSASELDGASGLIKSEPVKSEPVKSEPVKSEPVKPESEKNVEKSVFPQPVQPEPIRPLSPRESKKAAPLKAVEPQSVVSPQPLVSPVPSGQPPAEKSGNRSDALADIKAKLSEKSAELAEKTTQLKGNLTSQFNRWRETSVKIFRDRLQQAPKTAPVRPTPETTAPTPQQESSGSELLRSPSSIPASEAPGSTPTESQQESTVN